MREGPMTRRDLGTLAIYLAISIILLSCLYATLSKPVPKVVNSSVQDVVTYTDTIGAPVSLPPTIKRSDLDGYHLIKIEENGMQKYAIQHCYLGDCSIFGYRWYMDQKDYAERIFHMFVDPIPSVKLEEVVE